MDNIPKGFDYLFYSSFNKDLNATFGQNEALLKRHYKHNGQFENRKYCNTPDNFNWVKYITYVNNNPTIFGEDIKLDNKEDAINHYIILKPELPSECLDTNTDTNEDKPIQILYFAFLNRIRDWRRMIHDQLMDVKMSGIFEKSDFHAVIYGEPEDIAEVKIIIEQLLNRKIDITEIYTNRYEFPAIIKIRELAIQKPDKIFIYFHSKGMVNHNFGTYRILLERKLTLSTFLNWDETLYNFNTNSNIQKAGLMPSETGHIWFNFWWARGSYLAACDAIIEPDPLTEPDRFICEGWLGESGSKTWQDCYSIIDKKISFSSDPSNDCWYKICQCWYKICYYCD